MPLVAGGMTLTLLVAAFLIARPFLTRSSTQSPATEEKLAEHWDAGRRALKDGMFHVAVREFNAAIAIRERRPDLLASARSRELNQLQRQADLLSRIHNEALQDILTEALQTRGGEEWRERFVSTHKGRTVLLDDVLRRDPASGKAVLTCFEVRAGVEKAIVALDDLRVLNDLQLKAPQRVIFGARLQSLEQEAGGVWVFRFAAESGVLLTDADAAAACWPVPPDTDLLQTLQRQKDWLQNMPAQGPAP
jgi:hypothetical protein